MRPIRVLVAATTYTGGPGVDDLPVEEGVELNPATGEVMARHRSRWRPTDEERTAIALGGDIVLDVMGAAHPPVRVTTTEIPYSSPEKVYQAVDALLARGVATSIVSTLGMVGLELEVDEVLATWSTEDTKAVSEWMAARPSGEDPGEGDLAAWWAAKPAILP